MKSGNFSYAAVTLVKTVISSFSEAATQTSTVLPHRHPSEPYIWDDVQRRFIEIDHSVVINLGEELDHF
jgi:hypothetical protein